MNPQDLTPLGSLSFDKATDRGALFKTEAGTLEVAFWAEDIVRVRIGDADLPDYGIINGKPADVSVTVEQQGDDVFIRCGKGEVRVEEGGENPFNVNFIFDGKLRLGAPTDGHFVRKHRVPPFARVEDGFWFAFDLPWDTPVYGLGEKYGKLNRRGQLITNYVEDALGYNTDLCYKNAPFAWSPEGFGLFVHTPATVSHGVGYNHWSNGSYAALVEDEVLDLFLIAGDKPARILERYTDLTGRSPEVPLWSLGLWMSRAYYKDEPEATEIAKKIREVDLPCDVFTLDGRAWLDTDTRFAFEWDASRYPEPERFTKLVHELGMRVCCWEYPLVSVQHPLFKELADKGYLLKDKDGKPYEYEWDLGPFGEVLTPLPTSGILDFTNPDAAEWWGEQHKRLFDAGVDVMKTDFGEQVTDETVAYNGDSGKRLHNVYPLLYNECVYNASRKFLGKDGMVWGRAGWAGSQRAPIQWGGDPQVSWGNLAGAIVGGQAWGASGVPYYSHDIGGFYGGTPDDELFLRWAQAGIFGSHARFHGIGPREPWYFSEEVFAQVRELVKTRYRLLPYLQRACREAEKNGLPVQRAMAIAFPEDRAAWSFELQYMLGDSMLVAPVTRPGGKVSVYLPKGTWYCFFSGEAVEGGRVLDIEVPLDKFPVFVREGSVLALGPVVSSTTELTEENRLEEIRIYGKPRVDALSFEPALSIEDADGSVRIAGAGKLNVKVYGSAQVVADGDDLRVNA